MIIYQYDKSFDGLLTCIFEAYDRKMFPDILQAEGVPLPLFHEEVIRIITDERKSSRVWKGLEKRLSPAGPIRYHLLLVVRTSGYRPLTIPLYP